MDPLEAETHCKLYHIRENAFTTWPGGHHHAREIVVRLAFFATLPLTRQFVVDAFAVVRSDVSPESRKIASRFILETFYRHHVAHTTTEEDIATDEDWNAWLRELGSEECV